MSRLLAARGFQGENKVSERTTLREPATPNLAAWVSALRHSEKHTPRAARAAELSRELRGGTGDFLRHRRAIVLLSLGAIGAMGMVALYQTGVLKHLPEPQLPAIDGDRVDAAPEAYKRLATPDAALAIGSYAATLGLAAMSGPQRQAKKPWLSLAMGAKVALDSALMVRMIVVQWAKYRAFSFWSLLSAAATFASAPLAWCETRAALEHLRSTRR